MLRFGEFSGTLKAVFEGKMAKILRCVFFLTRRFRAVRLEM